jgi:predicted dinucleotide-binding enzyme
VELDQVERERPAGRSNTVTSAVLPTGELDGTPSDTFVASDDEEAKTAILGPLEGTRCETSTQAGCPTRASSSG